MQKRKFLKLLNKLSRPEAILQGAGFFYWRKMLLVLLYFYKDVLNNLSELHFDLRLTQAFRMSADSESIYNRFSR